MKFRTFYTIIGICFFAMGCKPEIAIDYNNMIAEEQKNLGTAMDAAEPRLRNYFASFEYDSIVSVSNRMEAKIDSIIQEIEKKPAPKAEQGENFKKAALNYFDYFKTIYAMYKNYGLQNTPEDRLSAGQDMAMILSHEDKMIADMLEAQRIFAKDNNFKIKETNQNNSLVKK
jgi:hypothetical protein